jgi:hypothetical protein
MTMSVEQMLFLRENVAIVDEMVETVTEMLDASDQDNAHAWLLDHCYTGADSNGVTSTQFQNMAATAVVLLAVERKKGKP